jgi:hypothetical protein
MGDDKVSLEFKNVLTELDKLREHLESLGESFGMSKKGISLWRRFSRISYPMGTKTRQHIGSQSPSGIKTAR